MKKTFKTLEEIQTQIKKHPYTVYLDEVGAGPLCGDMLIAAIVMPSNHDIQGLNDSKKLSEKKREQLFPLIMEKCLDLCIVRMTPMEIDQMNIFQARMEGFKRAISGIKKLNPTYAVIDGNKVPSGLSIEADFLIKADALLEGVAAASIVAKVTRDKEMIELSKVHPYSLYGLDKHKGYGTQIHLTALKEHGPIAGFHRFSYQPVKDSVR